MAKPQILFCNSLPADLSDAIMYIPEGSSVIECLVNSKPKKITVNLPAEKGEAIAAGMQASLESRLEGNVRPSFDFDHKGSGPASALPQKFYYEKGRGLMVECEWTGAGKKARKNKDYSYFSPTFLRDEDSGEPVGLPNRGPLGALVNDPAFRDIERVAASQAEPNQQTQPVKMQELITAGLLTEDEAKKDNAATVAAERVSTLKAGDANLVKVTAERDGFKAKLETVNAANADSKVAEAVTAGRIPAKDTETQAYWKGQIIEAGDSAISALNAIPVQDIEKKVVEAGAVAPEGKPARIEAAQAKARAELGSDASFQATWNRANEIDAEAFTD